MSLSEAVRESVKAEGVNLIVSDGKTAGQTLFHVHVHIIPRHEDDGFGFQFPTNYPSQPERERLDKDARAIRRLLRKVKVR
jgi:histidine triad (HIT) family protein